MTAFDVQLAKWAPAVRDAFLAAFRVIRDQSNAVAIAEALAAGNIEGAIALLRLDRTAFTVFDRAIENARVAGGVAALGGLKLPTASGRSVTMGFDARNTAAEAFARDHIGNLITAIIDDQKQAVRGYVSDALKTGTGPLDTARQIVGAFNRVTGNREGGIIGLTAQQAGWVSNMRGELGDPAAMDNYFTRQARNKLFDPMVRKAMEAGKPLSADDIDKITRAYTARLLKYRGDTIARVETQYALSAGRHDGYAQAVDKGSIRADQVIRKWTSSRDGHVRLEHMELDGQTVRGLTTPFIAPDGVQMLFPGDTSLGAPASSTINCLAPWVMVARIGLRAVMRRDYRGDLVELSLGGVVNLTVTPNHPVLTGRGWVPAGEVKKGDKLIHCDVRNIGVVRPGTDVKDMEATAEQLYSAAEDMGRKVRSGRVVMDLHGDVAAQNVDIVTMPRSLGDAIKSSGVNARLKELFASADIDQGRLLFRRLDCAGKRGFAATANSVMSGIGARLALIWSKHRSTATVAFAQGWFGDTHISQALIYRGAANSEALGYGKNRKPGGEVIAHSIVKRAPVFGPTLSAMGASGNIGGQRRNLKADVSEAGGDNAARQPGFAHKFGQAEALVKGLLNGVKVRLAGFRPMVNSQVATAVRRFHYEGPVYNFESETNVLISGGIVNHNCRCMAQYMTDRRKA